MVTFSEQFNDASWTKTALTISTSATANPVNGALTAQDAIPTAVSSTHRILKLAGAINTANTWSIFAKAKGYNFITIVENGNTSASVSFNLSTGAVSTQISAVGQIQSLGNGWYRCSMVHTTTASPRFDVYISPTDSITAYTGDGTSGVTLFGAQAVEGTSALDYFPTTNRQDVPRIDFRNADGTLSSCGRLLLEPQRTNSIRNSSMVGAVAGSPGTAPTNWVLVPTTGLSSQILGIGVENGLQYIDFRITGTASASNPFRFIYEQSTQIAALNSQTWTMSNWFRLTGTSVTVNLAVVQRNSFGGLLVETLSPISYTSSLQRYSFSNTNSNALTAFVVPEVRVSITSGTTYDFTIRIAAPQMELGAYATTWVPTTTAAVTRIGDSTFKSGLSSLFGTEGTWFIEMSPSSVGVSTTVFKKVIGLFQVNGSISDCIYLEEYNGNWGVFVRKANTTVVSRTYGTQPRKLAVTFGATGSRIYIDGVQATSTASNTSINPVQVSVTQNTGGAIETVLNVTQSAYIPTPLTQTQLAQLTTL